MFEKFARQLCWTKSKSKCYSLFSIWWLWPCLGACLYGCVRVTSTMGKFSVTCEPVEISLWCLFLINLVSDIWDGNFCPGAQKCNDPTAERQEKAQKEARNFELGSFEVKLLPWDFPVILQLHMRINWVRRIEPATAAIACSGRIFQYSALIHVLWVHFSITLSTSSPTSVWAQAILFCF